MTKVDENIKTTQNMLNWIVERYYELEEENKNLNKQIEQFKKWVKSWTNIIERLEEENKKLKERIKELEYLWDINEELKEENKKLKEILKLLDDSINKWL